MADVVDPGFAHGDLVDSARAFAGMAAAVFGGGHAGFFAEGGGEGLAGGVAEVEGDGEGGEGAFFEHAFGVGKAAGAGPVAGGGAGFADEEFVEPDAGDAEAIGDFVDGGADAVFAHDHAFGLADEAAVLSVFFAGVELGEGGDEEGGEGGGDVGEVGAASEVLVVDSLKESTNFRVAKALRRDGGCGFGEAVRELFGGEVDGDDLARLEVGVHGAVFDAGGNGEDVAGFDGEGFFGDEPVELAFEDGADLDGVGVEVGAVPIHDAFRTDQAQHSHERRGDVREAEFPSCAGYLHGLSCLHG